MNSDDYATRDVLGALLVEFRENRLLVAGIIAVVFVSSALFALFKQSVYEIHAKLEIGEVYGRTIGQEPIEQVRLTREKVLLRLVEGFAGERSGLDVRGQQLGRKAVLDITVRTTSPDEDIDVVRQVVDSVVKEHGEVFADVRERHEELYGSVRRSMAELEERAGEFDDGIQSTRALEPALAALLIIEKSRSTDERTRLYEALAELSAYEVKSSPTRVLMEVTSPGIEVFPTRVSIALGGLVIGVFLAFVLIYLKAYLRVR